MNPSKPGAPEGRGDGEQWAEASCLFSRNERYKVRPTRQCPNCGEWHYAEDLSNVSSYRGGTLYGVCVRCADRIARYHLAFDNYRCQTASPSPTSGDAK